MLTKMLCMKKIILLILLAVFSMGTYATTTFTLVTPPCNHDGLLQASFTGLTPPLTVRWTTYGSAGMTITHTGVSGLIDALTGYSGGMITTSVTDAMGVTDSIGFYSGVAPFTISMTGYNSFCPALDTAYDSVMGGTPPYTSNWYNIATGTSVGTGSAIALPPGTYGVTVTDAAGCVFGSRDADLFLELFSYAPFTDSFVTTTANCTNGSASVYPIGGGTAPFTYVWTNGATTPTIGGLVTGLYGVTITDALGCVYPSSTGTITASYVYVPQSIFISAPITTSPATCAANDGAVVAFGSGGMPPYTYVWSNGATTQSQTGLSGGYYSVNVTDANGCIGNDGASVGVSTPITVTYSTTPSLCTAPTGTATLHPIGGTGSYSILWYTWPVQTGLTASGLEPGTYAFKVTDAVGCIQTGSVVINPIDIINASFSGVSALCTSPTGSLNVYPTGGVPPYHYLWSTGATSSSISSVPAGYYSVRITDNLGCTADRYNWVSAYSPVGLGVTPTNETCIFANDGKLHATPFGGTPPYSYAWTGGGTTSTITGLHHGDYWAWVTDAAGCTANEYTHLGYNASDSCYCTINGTVYLDTNNSCTQDAGEPGIPHIQIHISGRGYTYTDDSGHYSYKVPSGDYTISETVKAFYPLAACETNDKPFTATAVSGCSHTVDFANAIDTMHDMQIRTWSYMHSAPIPGHSYTEVTIVTNNGTVQEDSIYSGYKTDGQLLPPTSFVPSLIFAGGSNYYNTLGRFPSVLPGGSQNFFMNFNVPTDIPLGTQVVTKDSVSYDTPSTHWLIDYSPWNNTCYFTTTVIASFDPNFKEVYPKGTGPLGLISYRDSVLEYMVHFQNTGSYMAENIVVKDTLDDNLDWTTLSPVYMSNKCTVTVEPSGSRKVATFTFNNINLPAESTDEMRSNAMFTYTIHIRNGLSIGTQFRNSASIYFDYNKPVKTNTTLNTLGSVFVAGVDNVSVVPHATFLVYPNPASTTFTAQINNEDAGNGTLRIAEVSGKELLNKTISLLKGSQNITTDVSTLAPGLYFVSFDSNGKTQTQKLVIMK